MDDVAEVNGDTLIGLGVNSPLQLDLVSDTPTKQAQV